ncbi:MAG: hypothetical protein E7177_01195 [Erysipelotrichaceae bacterium]|nr:hypothetical protein [Erysipelotrichaceae bacterium]
MKKNILLIIASSLLCLGVVGCTPNSSSEAPSSEPSSQVEVKSSITLEVYDEPIDFHTEIQKNYLKSGDPSILSSDIKGKDEFSLPKPVTLTWEDSKECSSYSVMISENENMSNSKRFFTSEKTVDIYNLKIDTTYYWRVIQSVKDGETSSIGSFKTMDYGPRNLYVDGVTNVRDVGGWMTSEGSRTQQGILFRGGRLNNSYPTGWEKGGDDTGYTYEKEITEDGEDVYLKEMGIKTEIDFRTRDRNGYPGTTDSNENLFPTVAGTQYISIEMDGGADVKENKDGIKKLFEILANKDNYPIYYHCNIGTDRTGMVTYLINALCGVGQQDLYYDYMFSNFGLIALPSPQVTNPKRKELTDLITGSGTANRVNNYEGSTLQEKARACLLDCGVSESNIDAVYNIMLGK